MIKIIDDLFTQEEARILIKKYCKEDNLGNKEIPVEDIWIGSPLYSLLDKIQVHFDLYKQTIPIKRDMYFDKVIAIKNSNTKGEPHPMHFDESVSHGCTDLALSCFVSLIYLNDDFKGGQLYFPFQEELIEPKVGRMLIFPCGPLYSHKILPFYTEDRYLLRIFHVFDSELNRSDRLQLAERLQLKQEKKEL